MMNKKIILSNYMSEPKEFVIEKFEDVKAIWITILSGDEIADVIYQNEEVLHFDSCNDNCRAENLYDGSYRLKLGDIDRFNERCNSNFASYEKMRIFE